MRTKLPETTDDQQFLLGLPEDLGGAETQFENFLKRKKHSGTAVGTVNLEILVALKTALGVNSSNTGASKVLANAIEESREMTGFISPDIVFMQLEERRKKLREQVPGAVDTE